MWTICCLLLKENTLRTIASKNYKEVLYYQLPKILRRKLHHHHWYFSVAKSSTWPLIFFCCLVSAKETTCDAKHWLRGKLLGQKMWSKITNLPQLLTRCLPHQPDFKFGYIKSPHFPGLDLLMNGETFAENTLFTISRKLQKWRWMCFPSP